MEGALQPVSSELVFTLNFLRTDALTFWSTQLTWLLRDTTTASREGANSSDCLRYFFFPKVSVPEHICVCVHHVLTLNSSLWVTNAPECVPPPPTDESHEEEVVHHLTIHSFTCRVKRKIESEWWKWTAVKRTTFYFAAGLTALNSLKTGDGCHHKKKSAQSCFLFL